MRRSPCLGDIPPSWPQPLPRSQTPLRPQGSRIPLASACLGQAGNPLVPGHISGFRQYNLAASTLESAAAESARNALAPTRSVVGSPRPKLPEAVLLSGATFLRA